MTHLPKEVWRIIPSLPEYLASSLGRLMRIPWVNPEGGQGSNRQYGGSPTFGTWSRHRFQIQFKGKTYRVARLICEAFHGPPPFEEAVCMHLDENSRNNVPRNLKWGTQKENLNAPGFLAYCKGRIGKDSPFQKWLAKHGVPI